MRCDGCKYWELGGERPSINESARADDKGGYCRRHAPKPYNFSYRYELLQHLTTLSWEAATEEQKEQDFKDWEDSTAGMTAWPVTNGCDWCGEFQPKSLAQEDSEKPITTKRVALGPHPDQPNHKDNE